MSDRVSYCLSPVASLSSEGPSGAIGVAWIVNIVTSIDWLYAGFLAASNQLVAYPMGGNWYIINYYVPVIGVIHVMIFARLLNERSSRPLVRRTLIDARNPNERAS